MASGRFGSFPISADSRLWNVPALPMELCKVMPDEIPSPLTANPITFACRLWESALIAEATAARSGTREAAQAAASRD